MGLDPFLPSVVSASVCSLGLISLRACLCVSDGVLAIPLEVISGGYSELMMKVPSSQKGFVLASQVPKPAGDWLNPNMQLEVPWPVLWSSIYSSTELGVGVEG